MTHSLHRSGSCSTLQGDYVLLVMPARGVNLDDSSEKMRQVWDIISNYQAHLANFGSLSEGNSQRSTIATMKNGKKRLCHAVFTNSESLKSCLQKLRERDFGISVVVSGLYDEVARVCSEIGLTPHTVNLSLGVHGNTERLPDENILEITTMCGHGLVASTLVNSLLQDVKARKRTCESAANEMSRLCECGIFNPSRAVSLLNKMSGQTVVEDGRLV